MVTTVVIFAASMLLGECHELPPSTASTFRAPASVLLLLLSLLVYLGVCVCEL